MLQIPCSFFSIGEARRRGAAEATCVPHCVYHSVLLLLPAPQVRRPIRIASLGSPVSLARSIVHLEITQRKVPARPAGQVHGPPQVSSKAQ